MMHRRIVRSGVAAALLAAGTVWAQGPKALWEIGKADRDYQEFALAGDYQAYAKTFPRDVAFTVGQSDPKKDWSWIQPGPADAWAGQREHPFAIRFDLADEPAGLFQLKIDLLDAQAMQTPRLRVDVNGTAGLFLLHRGHGDAALTDPRRGKPQTVTVPVHPSLLKRTGNCVTLTAVDGSWVLYDAVALVAGDAGTVPIEIKATPTVFFVKRDGRLMQVVRVRVSGLPPKERSEATVTIDGAESKVLLDAPALGPVEQEVPVVPVDRTTKVTLSITSGGQTQTTVFDLKPQKRWRVFAAPSTHTDIGYTHVQSEVIAVHNRNTDFAIRLCREFPGYKWNLESSWAAQMYRRDRFDEAWDALIDLAKKERIGIEAGYLNMLTGLCSTEELIRNMYYSARLHREAGIPFDSLTLTDAPSHVWGLPSILASAGVRYLSIGANQTRAPVLRKNLHLKSPCWWEGPDGQKVLTNFTDGYAQSGRIGLGEPLAQMRGTVERFLAWWNERQDYPFDAVLLHGAYGDNQYIGEAIAQSQAAFASAYEYPKVHIGRLADYFGYIEKHFADRIQTVRGCGGSWWEDGAASTAKHTGWCRVAHNRVVAAEMLWAAAAMTGSNLDRFPQDTFDRVWDNILLYDEHTWGSYNSISEPWKDFTQEQWAVKAKYAVDALEDAERLAADGLHALARRIGAPAGSVLVFNPLNWARTDAVRVYVPDNHVLFDGDAPVPTQKLRDYGAFDDVVFLAKDVPAIGYRWYRVGPNPQGRSHVKPEAPGAVLENRFYRVTFAEGTGAIRSILDKETGKELVDAASPYQLNQVVHLTCSPESRVYDWNTPWPPPKFEVEKIAGAQVLVSEPGEVRRSARATGRGRMIEEINNEVILYDHVKRIDFVNRINKRNTYDPRDAKPTYHVKESVYIAFPFAAGAKPDFRYEIGGGSVRPNADHLPGGCRDWLSVQNWVSVAGEGIGVAWCPIDTPLVTLSDIWRGEWSEEWPIRNGTILAWPMNNYWMTNYKACQDGWFEFRYSITSGPDMPEAKAARFGWDAASFMPAVRLDTGGQAPPAVPSASFCRVSDPGTIVSTVKRADDGKGVIVRLLEVAGGPERNVDVALSWPGVFTPGRATACDVVERNKAPLPLADNAARVKLTKYGMATVRFE